MKPTMAPKLEEAIRIICQYNQASASLLQRKLSTSYSRAAKLMDLLEGMGVIALREGYGPQKVLIQDAERFLREHNLGEAVKNARRKILIVDPLLGEAAGIVSQYDRVAPSLLMRKLDTVFDRAEEIMFQLAESRVVEPSEGSKMRTVLIRNEDKARTAIKRFIEGHEREKPPVQASIWKLISIRRLTLFINQLLTNQPNFKAPHPTKKPPINTALPKLSGIGKNF